MRLTEAAATGRPYKRKSDTSWRQPHHNHTFAPGDLVADDWVVEETPVSITPSQFWEAYRETLLLEEETRTLWDDPGYVSSRFGPNLAKKLGLE
jgi:hypothetical protein